MSSRFATYHLHMHFQRCDVFLNVLTLVDHTKISTSKMQHNAENTSVKKMWQLCCEEDTHADSVTSFTTDFFRLKSKNTKSSNCDMIVPARKRTQRLNPKC